jgi:excisionase family DNA binding protein
MATSVELTSATMTVDDAAKLLGIGRNQAYSAARRGELPVMKLGKRILVLRAPLERLLRGEATPKAA